MLNRISVFFYALFLHAKNTFPFMRREVKYAFLTAFTFSFDICERSLQNVRKQIPG
jgi:hypothetical protein